MRRRSPEPVSGVLRDAIADAAPNTLLARVQALWPEVAGASIAAESAPASEYSGSIKVECAAAVWAQELTLLEPDIRARLNSRLGELQVRSLRFIVKAP